MRCTRIILTLAGILILCPLLSQAQFIIRYKKKGDSYFHQKNYYAAAVYYKKALKASPYANKVLPYTVHTAKALKENKDAADYRYLLNKLGDCYRLYADYANAASWYEKVLKSGPATDFPLVRLWYAVCLRAEGKFNQAIAELKAFQSSYDQTDQYSERAQLELKSNQYAIAEMKYPRIASVDPLPGPVDVDSGSNYAPVKVGDTLYFTSSRAIKKVKKKESPYINKVYYSIMDKGSFSKPQKVKLSDRRFSQVAAQSLNNNHTRLYFTEWHVSKKETKSRYVIMMSERDEDGQMQTPQVLPAPVNVPDYSTKEATVTADGRYLVFSSNRPGGSGGYDLWYCKLNEKGMPEGDAVNVGSDINTGGDEVNPYYDAQTKELVFSTDRRVGMGGFDLFKSRGGFANNQWSTPENLGYPVNSSKDDVYYFPAGKKEAFYTSSDRNSVCCLDLYAIQMKYLKVIGHVYDSATHEPIANVNIILNDSVTANKMARLTTANDGFFHFKVKNRRPLTLHFSNKKYGRKDIVITNAALKQVDSVYRRDVYLALYEINKPIIIRNIYYDFDKATLRPKSKLALDTLYNLLNEHADWIVEIGSHTDSIGASSYNEWLSQQRAQSVVDYLVNKGIAKDRLVAKGYGKSRPIAPNSKPDGTDNPEGRQLNRRTEFKIIGLYHKNGTKSKKKLYESVVGDKRSIKVDYSHQLWLSRRRHLKK